MSRAERVELKAIYKELSEAAFELPLLGEGYVEGPRVPEMKKRFRLALHRLHVFVADRRTVSAGNGSATEGGAK